MEFKKRKSVSEKLNKFDVLAKDDAFIEVTEWTNGEGNDIIINDDKFISLTWGELEAINHLIKALEYNFPKDKEKGNEKFFN